MFFALVVRVGVIINTAAIHVQNMSLDGTHNDCGNWKIVDVLCLPRDPVVIFNRFYEWGDDSAA